MRLVGINGYARSGKDTVCAFVEELTEGVFKRAAYADKMKIMAARSLGFDRPEDELIELMDSIKLHGSISTFYDEPANPSTNTEDNAVFHFVTGREFLQNFGEHGRQTFGEDFWIDLVLPPRFYSLKEPYPGVDVLVVTDCRHSNEARRVLDYDGEIWHVVRPGVESDGHITETRLPAWLIDRTIINDGSLEHLRAQVKEALDADRD